jgi:hypothetical protein
MPQVRDQPSPELIKAAMPWTSTSSDCLNAGGCHWQIKRQETTKIWEWIAQAEAEAPPTELPIVAFRRNRSKWYCVIDADELVTLLRLREGA